MFDKIGPKAIEEAINGFVQWLSSFGETSQDHQDFYAGGIGARAKELYYKKPILGTIAVSPMVLCEAFLPKARKFFHHPMRLPIADAHYAMGFALLYEITKDIGNLYKARHFCQILKETRCRSYRHFAWGYPFDWQTKGGVIKAGTPLITTVPYCYEAFEYLYRIDNNEDWHPVMRSIAEHAFSDYMDVATNDNASSCSYTPQGGCGVLNASAYRAFLLTAAGIEFGDGRYLQKALENLQFVLASQGKDGSRPYAVAGDRDFIDHFHTCFVLKALAKIEKLTGNVDCRDAISRGVGYYAGNLCDENGLPKPFAKAPRMTVYRRELYDYAECLNLGVLLQGRFPELDRIAAGVLNDLFNNWKKRDGSFRSRKLLVAWDNVPMHRWGQSMIFRSLCLIWQRATETKSLSEPNKG